MVEQHPSAAPALPATVQGTGGTKYTLLSKGNVRATIEKLRKDYKAREFAQLLIKDRHVADLFFHHWRQLTLLPEMSIPLFVDTDQALASTDSLSREAREATGRSGVAFEGIIAAAAPVIERKVQALVARLKSAGVDIDKTEGGTLVFQAMSMLGAFSGGLGFGTLVGLIKPFEDYFADEMGDFGLELLSAVKAGIRDSGNERLRRIIGDSGLTSKRYRAVIAKMVSEGYLRVACSVFWCDGHPALPVSLVTVGESNHITLTCRICGEPLLGCHFLIPSVHSMILVRQYDGILQYLLPWTLEENGIPWAANVYLEGLKDDREKDLVFFQKGSKGLTIVECKSDYTDSPERTVNQKLRDHLIQLARAVGTYRNAGVNVEGAILATNHDATDERRAMLARWLDNDSDFGHLKGVELKLVGPNNLSKWWKLQS